MSNKPLYKICSVADESIVAEADWQNASELVRHGFWKWVRGNGKAEFEHAQSVARMQANGGAETPELVVELTPEPEEEDDDGKEEEADGEAGDQGPAVPAEEEVAATAVPTAETAPMDLEDMSRDELYEFAMANGLMPDKRLGTKNLIAAIRTAQGEAA